MSRSKVGPAASIPVPGASTYKSRTAYPGDHHRRLVARNRTRSLIVTPCALPVSMLSASEFGHTSPGAAQQLRGAAQDPPRVTAPTDVAVDQQNCLPTAHSGLGAPPACGERLEYVSEQGRRAALARQPGSPWPTGRRQAPVFLPFQSDAQPSIQAHNPIRWSDRCTSLRRRH